MSHFLKTKSGFFQEKKQRLKISKYLFISTLLLKNLIFTSPVYAQELNTSEVTQFLHTIACSEMDEWPTTINKLKVNYPSLMADKSSHQVLSALRVKILETDDLDLIKLFQRAIRNHDTFSDKKADPVAIFYKHYKPPDFFVTDIHLTFDVSDSSVGVVSDLKIKRNSPNTHLILDGKEHQVHRIFLNGQLVSKENYKITPHELILFNLPEDDSFNLKIFSEIDPFSNDSLEGMYRCGRWLTTQCESEGARRIFFTLDRPDVLSSITTTIIADQKQYPYRLSNGNLVGEKIREDGRSEITWHDPFPKPSYLFACVLGDFSQLSSSYVTKSGKKVELQVYVEPGKKSRAEYSLYALKKSIEFDELFFDREYDLSCLKMVGIPDFNSGAMENKGLMIFNDIRLLVDPLSGSDRSFRDVAHTIGHEYFHNWSGNRVTIRNWFEIALKEAFTDFRAILFSEWLFGSELIRPKAVQTLKEFQFPEESSERGHPIIVESYIDPHSIYDNTTYVKGREIFRTLKNHIDMLIPEGFRQVQNLYFSQYDGQAVTFRELLKAGNNVLKHVFEDLNLFERWFHQQGTPLVSAQVDYDSNTQEAIFSISQTCLHPRTGKKHLPFQIPFSVELLGKNGSLIHPKFSLVLQDELTVFRLPSSEKPLPIFMHGYCAPVAFTYPYTLEELALIIKHTDDAYCRWEAIQNYSILALKEMKDRTEAPLTLESIPLDKECHFAARHASFYHDVLNSLEMSPLAKAQILEIPSIRAISQAWQDYDFDKIGQLRYSFIEQLASLCKPDLEKIIQDYPSPENYEPSSPQMQIRELRHVALGLLALTDIKYQELVMKQYKSATNFDDSVTAFNLCLHFGGSYKEFVVSDFYMKWKDDKAVFNFWLASQASSSQCSIEDLRRLESVDGYEAKNPNHVRSVSRAFITNLRRYHSQEGRGYEYIVDKILEIAKFNPFLAHSHLAVPAFVDYERLPEKNKTLMTKALQRLRLGEIPPQTKDLIDKLLGESTGAF